MNTQPDKDGLSDLDRRSFLKGSSLTTLMLMMGGVPLNAQEKSNADEAPTPKKPVGPPVNCAVIGCGAWGRDHILNTLARLPNAPVVAICDTYAPFLRRAKEGAPKAEQFQDYRKVLERKDVQAVVVATPSHQHREIVEAALKAGKHVYCEAPLAHTIEDARAIAKAAKAATKQYFQAGLQMRSDPQRHFLLPFIRSGAIGKWVMARAQWHKKESWRRTSPNADREKEVNWRLRQSSSPGLIGEIGIHQVDVVGWFLNQRPLAVTGFGGIMNWTDDGRDVPDTIQAMIEYRGGVRLLYDATLANSFDADYEVLFGSDAAIMLRQNKAWMFKEVDSPLLGWEVYAQKDTFYKETGIALVADATKLAAVGTKPVEEVPFTNTPLSSALEAFISNTGVIASTVENFTSLFGDDEPALKEKLEAAMKTASPAAGYREGYEATVIALKTNEAIVKGQKVAFQKEWFELG
jgi:predicted dehydrogenase